MSGKIYVLNQRQEETFDAAGKAMRDVFSVLADKGAGVIWSMPKNCSRYLKILDLPYLVLFLLFRVGSSDCVFYSIPENHIRIRLLQKIKRIKKYRIICFINDLNAFRYDGEQQEETQENKEELAALAAADDILAPNVNTVEMLKKAGITSNLIPVGIWDYLMTEEQEEKLAQLQDAAEKLHDESGQPDAAGQFCDAAGQEPGKLRDAAGQEPEQPVKIAFAGNLNKSEFLSVMDVPEGISMELWGRLDEQRKQTLPAGCHYHGVLSSDEVPLAVCTMDYGLVWDGVGKDGIEGGLGEYLRYNNSHKCALYLASGIPVIVWSRSGMAHFVEEHGCGMTIERLSELAPKIKAADYAKQKQAALAVAPKLRSGYYLGRAVDTACGGLR